MDGFLGLSLAQWTDVAKALGPIAAALVTYQQRRFFARPRAKLRADLEMLELFSDDAELAEAREALINSIQAQSERIYGTREARPAQVNWWLTGLGVVTTAACSYWTFEIFTELATSDWWAVLSIWLGLAGIGWMIMGWQGEALSRKPDAAPNPTPDG